MSRRGAVAAGHPLTAEAGAAVLREGGNAVDAAVAAVLTSFVTESPLTGLGAGGFMLVHAPGTRTCCSTSSSRSPGRTAPSAARSWSRSRCTSAETSPQVFNVGAASCGVPGHGGGTGGGAASASARFRWRSSSASRRGSPARASR